ncbi:hypothetical protein M378DRAFT_168824 [Amanita muscaria Koide BX008]|uniref:Uncharacterized protein n=1 Tax=Amanita muscaria (strain Koide BX008) TaxID=946122 RepID=A0A0C2SAH5_AMAMK|nr:hypothetical protein M378DRAFT_168824 [Amanita muscaria Koide BX008]
MKTLWNETLWREALVLSTQTSLQARIVTAKFVQVSKKVHTRELGNVFQGRSASDTS